MDPLSDVFMAMQVRTSEYVRLEFAAPWGFRFDGYEHAHFGVVHEGSCWLQLQGDSRALKLASGDCWLLPRGHTHTLCDAPGTKIHPYNEIQPTKKDGVVQNSGRNGAATTTIIVGNFKFDGESARWLTNVLPQLITFRMDDGHTSAMQTVLRALSLESRTESMGSAVVVNSLAVILFVQAVRAYAASAGERGTSWLRAIGDRRLSIALRTMHQSMDRQWTVASLGSNAGMSRSAFATHFKQVLGEAPLAYLTRWRMYKAGELLRKGELKLAELASQVGYQSDGAFNKAFKKVMGCTPGAYRRSISARGAPHGKLRPRERA